MIAIQPQTGFIRAMVGGRDFYESQFNRITQARRQVGSVFKPFVYAAGFLRAYEDPAFSFTPATLVDDAPFTVTNPGSPPWTPHNYDGKYEGTVNARHALQKSRNVPTAKFAMEIGIDRIAGLAHRMGITSGLPEFPSLSLGSADLSPMEVASAYSTLANQGTHAEPLAIRDVVDANGRVLEKKPVEIERVVQPEVAYLTTSLMESVINHGTGARARALGFRHPAAGKTGTTNDYKDAWFVGFTPKILAAVWVGFDDNRELRLTGSAAALPIWTKFMISQLSKSVPVPFEVPERIVRRKIDPESGMLAGFDCPQFTEEVFLEGTEPEEECELHSDSVLDFFKKLGKPGGKQ
ncbi:MAG: penicillin-binding transpeptidase domain-containing protein [Deltaproteobacteria bacterium]|nr:penicillin-binding transpeptidase domain-containing protein [Deltaproteobacteria bacterium]